MRITLSVVYYVCCRGGQVYDESLCLLPSGMSHSVLLASEMKETVHNVNNDTIKQENMNDA